MGLSQRIKPHPGSNGSAPAHSRCGSSSRSSSELKILAPGWGGGGRREGEEREDWVGEQGCRAGPRQPGRPNDPDVQLQRDDRFGDCKSLAPGGPSRDRVRREGELEREGRRERNLRKREL